MTRQARLIVYGLIVYGMYAAALMVLAACSAPERAAGDFALALAFESVMLEPSGEVEVDVTVERRGGFAEAVVVTLLGAPEGLSAEALTVAAGETRGRLVLRAAQAAPLLTDALLTVRGSAAGVDRDATLTLSVNAASEEDTDGNGDGAPDDGADDGDANDGEDATDDNGSDGELEPFRLLVFSKTARGFFRHGETITAGVAALRRLGAAEGFAVDHSEDASVFSDEVLADYAAVFFLMTTGPVLDAQQQRAFERFIRGGGGFVGAHSPTVVAYSDSRPSYWPWYEGLVGAYFRSQSGFQDAVIVVENRSHPSTAHLGARWEHHDEIYSFHSNPRGAGVTVLLRFDVTSVEGTTMGDDHPVAWYHAYDGGRAWYTSLGHFPESWQGDEAFLQHILGGVLYAAGR